MIGLLRFVFAVLVWPFTSQARASRRDCGAPPAGDCPAAEEQRQSSAEQRRPMVLRPALSHVSFDLAGAPHHPTAVQLSSGWRGSKTSASSFVMTEREMRSPGQFVRIE